MLRRARVDFSRTLREWDGFGVNYVEASQTRDYAADPQDYGGFSLLDETGRQEILDLIFAPEGLRPGVVKMFLDPFHQAEPGAGYAMNDPLVDLSAYDHETTTRWMRHFAREGLARTRRRGADLEIVVTLYGPPAWITRQEFIRGRDLDPRLAVECAKYMVSWAKYLREVEGLPVRYISLHNEGEDWMRWPADGSGPGAASHDYNLYWPPEQVVDFVKRMPPLLAANGLGDAGVTCGECSNWYRFVEWGYADALADDADALDRLGLITSHGFFGGRFGQWFGDWRSTGVDRLRSRRPDLHAWVTSTSWSKMDVDFLNEIRNSLYAAKVNALIPWACVQRAEGWVGGDPNPGTAFRVHADGRWQIEAGYWWYKQVCRAGQPGMAVAHVVSNDSEIALMAFAAHGSGHPDALVVLNLAEEAKEMQIEVAGSRAEAFDGYRTGETEQYVAIGRIAPAGGRLPYVAPGRSATTFFAC
jgi:hypothetical protein